MIKTAAATRSPSATHFSPARQLTACNFLSALDDLCGSRRVDKTGAGHAEDGAGAGDTPLWKFPENTAVAKALATGGGAHNKHIRFGNVLYGNTLSELDIGSPAALTPDTNAPHASLALAISAVEDALHVHAAQNERGASRSPRIPEEDE
ncbi:hypothetical protein FA95DRAFT_1614159 [Auriscalpium vulgare]|uniref:Uncharacterized protein n=1 Tax=Auriscalpium vulgare TaxID=40419 RepID=A0ACB8R0S0_9AGAM|nr:hypothetical protein FA95DRAFT_1614159 [Auriscalpium vulgare]